MDHSVGDRVEVLREQKLHTAEVRAVYDTGKVDVVYDVESPVGYLLSVAEHGLNKMWMPEKKGKGGGGENAKVCSVAGCSNTIKTRGLCANHGKKPCSVEGCTTKAMARGLCGKHGARGKCVTMGCVTNALKRGGNCRKHSKKVACAHPNCSTPFVVGKGVCAKHGAFGICTAWGCKTNAAPGKKGHCLKHSKDKPTCSASDCRNAVIARGLCFAHGARGFCSTAGCGTGALKDGLCYKHGAYGFCTFTDCTTAAQSRGRGLCARHGGGSTKVCDIEGCKTRAVARSRCARHGAFGWCKGDGCTTPAAQASEHCIAHGGGKKKRPCSVAACITTSNRKGLCVKHGGGKEECKIAGCTSQSYGFLKTCTTHGGSGYCQHPSGCIAPATKYGANCYKHTKKKKKD
eukprot:gene6260-biopygen16876